MESQQIQPAARAAPAAKTKTQEVKSSEDKTGFKEYLESHSESDDTSEVQKGDVITKDSKEELIKSINDQVNNASSTYNPWVNFLMQMNLLAGQNVDETGELGELTQSVGSDLTALGQSGMLSSSEMSALLKDLQSLSAAEQKPVLTQLFQNWSNLSQSQNNLVNSNSQIEDLINKFMEKVNSQETTAQVVQNPVPTTNEDTLTGFSDFNLNMLKTAQQITTSLSSETVKLVANGRPAELIQQIGQKIAEVCSSGRTSLHIQLQPENLGRIDVRVISGNDGMRIVITSDNPQTNKLLENNLNQLQTVLSAAGVQIGGMSVGNQNMEQQYGGLLNNIYRKGISSINGIEDNIDQIGSSLAISSFVTGFDYQA